ncbi:hypothetical protein [Gorillibacterium sp. sgz500922]|uniref:hypothetical protein n=1 Tax=Gorillibacterium sp. sgz500922 TaxID=3446694 RepID=UPI003F6734E5
MDQFSSFLADRWYIVLIAILVILLVLRLVKTIVKWILVLAIAAAALYYGYHYEGSLDTLKQTVVTEASQALQEQASALMKKEAASAKYVKNKDGSYTVTTNSLKVEGKPGEDEVTVTVLKQSFPMKASAVKAFVEAAARNQP